jgi:UDP-N-acetylmuramyl pentapeptide phosphotransferase/UDP-N-acetylglucosamine-1-phosphate transferase
MEASVASLSALPLAFAVSALVTVWLTRASHARLLDRPNERSLHETPVPRSGGLGMASGLVVGWLVLWSAGGAGHELASIVVAVGLVSVVSLWDDLGDVSRRLRLAVHVLAAVLLGLGGLLWRGLDFPGVSWGFPAPLAWMLTLLFVVWMINLYNFMDGMDGFAGGMAVFGFLALAALGWRAGEPGFAVAAACVAASAGGFLTRNFPPARIFLGDLGSSALGLLAAALSLWGAARGLFPLWAAWLAFSPFIVDATWTLLRRLINRERVWEAHRSHHYQRLVLSGWGHRKTVLAGYLVMVAACACAVAAPTMTVPDQWVLLGAWAAIYGLIHYRVRLAERQVTAAP